MRQPPVQNRVYDKEYYAGTQAGLYIGDVLVDEVNGFAFSVQQTKTPIYGYASQLFNAVSAGPVIVTGSFTINFKEANYLYIVLMRYHQFNKNVEEILRRASIQEDDIAAFKKSLNRGVPSPFWPNAGKQAVIRQGIEGILNGTADTKTRYNFYQSLSGYASVSGLDVQFEDVAEVLEDSVWGVDANSFDEIIRRTDDNYFDGFDIYLTYGDYNNPGANHTVERITGVHLTGRGKEVRTTGEPILEEYQFIARNSF